MRIASTLLTAATLALLAGCSSSDGTLEAVTSTLEETTLAESSQPATSTTAPEQWEVDMSSRSSVRSAEKAAEEAAEREAREAVQKMIADEEEINDAAFITTLDMFGVHYSSREGAIRVAKTICSNFDSGMDGLTAAMSIVASGQYSPEQAGAMVGAATSIYCPEYEHLIPG